MFICTYAVKYLLSLWFVLVFFFLLNLSFILSGFFLLCLSLLLLNRLLYGLSLEMTHIDQFDLFINIKLEDLQTLVDTLTLLLHT